MITFTAKILVKNYKYFSLTFEKENKNAKRNKQKQMKQKDEELFTTSSTYKIASRLCCNFSFPDPPGRPVKKSGEY